MAEGVEVAGGDEDAVLGAGVPGMPRRMRLMVVRPVK